MPPGTRDAGAGAVHGTTRDSPPSSPAEPPMTAACTSKPRRFAGRAPAQLDAIIDVVGHLEIGRCGRSRP